MSSDPEILRLYAAILDDPDDGARRLALADRLDRIGEGWHAHRIRTEVELAANPSPWAQFDHDGKRLSLHGSESCIVEPDLPEGMHVAFLDRGVVGGISVHESITAPIEAALRKHRGMTA